ncbi:MAG: tetratricopeptide repeat protein [Nitrospinae bacterium]|nr:tetratricopeptide repeat protein [Nitrospinota bacterium]
MIPLNNPSYRFPYNKLHCVISRNPRQRTTQYALLGFLPLALCNLLSENLYRLILTVKISIIFTVLSLSFYQIGCHKESPEGLYTDAEDLWSKARYIEAAKRFIQLVEDFPESVLVSDSLYRLGEIYYLNLNDSQEGIKYFYEVIRQGKNGENSYNAQRYIAEIYDKTLNDYEQAIIEYHRLINDYDKDDMADKDQYQIAQCYFKKGDFEQAIIEFDILREEYPESKLIPDSYYQKANSLYMLGRYNDAIAVYNDLLKEYPQNRYAIDARFGIASSIEEKERFREALTIYEEIREGYGNKDLIDMKIDRLQKRINDRYR